MVLNIVQTRSGVEASFEISSTDGVIATAAMTNNVTFGGTWLIAYKGTSFSMQYKRLAAVNNLSKKAEEKNHVSYGIVDSSGNIHGYISRRESTGSIFKRYEYIGMEYNGAQYSAYIIGLGKEGYRFPIYKGALQIAEIEKDCVVYDNLDRYTAYLTNDSYALETIMVCLYLDYMMFARRGEIPTQAVSKSFLRTTNKLVLEKFDPSFKDSVS